VNISQITNKTNKKSTNAGNFTTHFPKVLTSKVHSACLKKRILLGVFAKFCQNYAHGVTYPVVMSYFLNLEEALLQDLKKTNNN
jgi:hypothetical protein